MRVEMKENKLMLEEMMKMNENKIKDYEIDYTNYLDIRKVVAHYKQWGFNKIALITDNGCGKTYNATNMVMDYLLQGKHCC
jgi:hypothetical protein